MLLSLLVPVYNERTVVEGSLARVLAAPLPENMDRELIVVDDCSTDGTSAILERLAAADSRIRLFRHPVNQGKGAAVRTAITHATGDFCLVQDADLEYDPTEYPRLLKPLLEGHADAVFGSRYLVGEQTRVLPFWHSNINRFLTLVSNMFSNLGLTDMETCYKVFRTDLLKSIPIRSNRFGFEPEITMKASKRQLRIYEVPISYHGRTYEEGKKIGWRDGMRALGVIVYFWLIDDIYAEPYGRGSLNKISGTPRYVSWIAHLLRPYLRDTVLEIGGGIGNIAGRLMGRRLVYMVTEQDPIYLHALRNRFLRTLNVKVAELDPARPDDFERLPPGTFQSALMVNMLEYLPDPEASLRAALARLESGGTLIVVTPQGPGLFGSLDRWLGHQRRFTRSEIDALLERNGCDVVTVRHLNKIGKPMWWFYSRIIHRSHFSRVSLKIYDKTVWLWRRLDHVLPWSGLSMVVVAKKR
jgi:glycosyltransferase involved in cell wall biosynthesis